MSSYLISALEYDNWVYNWKQREHTGAPFNFFLKDSQVQTGVAFIFDHLRYLLSTTGIETIKIRFGVREYTDGQDAQFYLVLFAADKDNTVISPYFTSEAFTYDTSVGIVDESEGNLPQALMEQWRADWRGAVKAGTVDPNTFKIRYGFLQGYNYPVKEFMEALGAFKGASTIHILYGLHTYYAPYETAENPPVQLTTMGLVLYATQLPDAAAPGQALDGSTNVIIDESGYYDLTAPCPQTC